MADEPPHVVTLNTVREGRARGQAESAAATEPLTLEERLYLARYDRVVQRIEDETRDAGPDVFITARDREVSMAMSKMAEDGTPGQPLPSGGVEAKFGTGLRGGDVLGWAKSLFDHVDDPNQFREIERPKDLTIEQLPPDATVALMADWGTAMYGAPKIAGAIRALAKSRPFDLLMHLGDVYYSGTKKETEQRFVKAWPREAGKVSRALNGNHEMYSGGYGYFDVALPALEQDSSYFAFRNKHWLLVGLDTAYVDHDMDGPQVAWLNLVIDEAQRDNPSIKLVLFSHHQPYSRLGEQGHDLRKTLRPLLEANRITAWYWGHEHQCLIYDAHPEWGLLGRCLGHGGIPERKHSEVVNAPVVANPNIRGCVWKRLGSIPESPGCIALDGPNLDMVKPSDQKKFVPHGFMTLEFKADKLIERALASTGEVLYENTIG